MAMSCWRQCEWLVYADVTTASSWDWELGGAPVAVSILPGLQPPLPWNKTVPKHLPSVWLLVYKSTARKFLDKWNEKEERWRSGEKKGTEGKMAPRVYCPGDPAKAGVCAAPLGGGIQWPWTRSQGQGGST